MHFTCSLHSEMHTILARELQLGIDQFVGTVVVDKNFSLFEVSSGGKWGVAGLSCLDVVSNCMVTRPVEFCSGDDAHWVMRVGVVYNESLSGLESDYKRIDPCRSGSLSRVRTTRRTGWWIVDIPRGGLGGSIFHVDIRISKRE